MKIVINTCFGGFGFSSEAYEKLASWGVPVCKYSATRDEEEVIFDRELTPVGEDSFSDLYWKFKSVSDRYWDTWTRSSRTHPLLIRLVEEMGKAADGKFSELKVVEIPDGTEYEIDEYDGVEHIAEKHRTWS